MGAQIFMTKYGEEIVALANFSTVNLNHQKKLEKRG